jgi:tripartite-type tricarboxylate transporter receptor subunit TctC
VKRRDLLLAGLAWAAVAPGNAWAESYPSRPIKLIVPLGAGGSVDLMARSCAAGLSKQLGEPIVVENKPGGGTVIGATDVAHATPDGYTLMVAPSGTFTIEVALHKELPYDPMKDFVPIAHYADLPSVLVVNSALPINSVQELIAYVKERPGKISYAASTVGGVYHLTGEIFKHDAGLTMTPVFYRQGGPAALNDVLSGVLPFGFSDIGVARSLLTTNKIRALGVTSTIRVPALPNVPTIAESGVPGFNVVSWHMLVAPAGVPSDIIERLRIALAAVFADPEQKERMRSIGLIPIDTPTPPTEELRKFLAAEIARWTKVVQQANLAGTM